MSQGFSENDHGDLVKQINQTGFINRNDESLPQDMQWTQYKLHLALLATNHFSLAKYVQLFKSKLS